MKLFTAFLFAGVAFSQSGFPTIAPNGLTYMDPNTLNLAAFSYQQADYDGGHNQVLFYPYGSVSGTPLAASGVLLVYDPVAGGFANPANWVQVDLTSPVVGVSPYAWNFGGGFTDGSGPGTSLSGTNPTYAYLPAGPHFDIPGGPTKAEQGNVSVQVNLAALATDPQNTQHKTYSFIDLNTIPTLQLATGGFSGVWANGSAYFCPTFNANTGNANTVLTRYNSALGAFGDSAAWESFDLATIPVSQGTSTTPNPNLGGMQSAAYIAPNVYMIPFSTGNESTDTPPLTAAGTLVVYDTTKPFASAESYSSFDLTTLSSMNADLFPANVSTNFHGYTGGVVVNGGTKLILVPWGVRTLAYSNSLALEYDTTKAINDPSAWTDFDLFTVNPKAAGYQFGWLDKNGFVWFVPTHNFQASTLPAVPPFVVYNTALPFNEASSWITYANSGNNGIGAWLTGAAYNPVTNTAWMAGYGEPLTSTPPEISYNLELQEGGITSGPSLAAVASAASYSTTVAAGSIVAVFGTFLVGSSVSSASLPLPDTLSGLTLDLTGKVPVPMFYASEEQVNAQIPWEVAGQSQTAITASINGQTTAPVTVTLAAYAPAIFAVDGGGNGQGAILDGNYNLVSSSNPTTAGAYIQIYGTGLGPVTNQPATGAPAPGAPLLAETTVAPTVKIGGVQAQVVYSGLAPGTVGLYQINAQVPNGVTSGSSVDVTVSIGGVQSNVVTLAVQ
jgi:uncharacterized protein (TIGR03437 family)